MQTNQSQPFSEADFCLAYETGQLSEVEVVTGFQRLIDSGTVWELQGMYGRTARDLIQAGLCTMKVVDRPDRVGPFEGVILDRKRKVSDDEYRIVLYSAYNACGLVGSESNGVAVLSETRREVVADEIGCGQGQLAQKKIFQQLLDCSEQEFRDTINGSGRNRYMI